MCSLHLQLKWPVCSDQRKDLCQHCEWLRMKPDGGIERERALLAEQLGSIIDIPASDVERGMILQNESYLPYKRNIVAVLARVAQLTSLAEDLRQNGSHEWWRIPGSDGRTPLERLRSGAIDDVTSELGDRKAGPYDLDWDPSWPSDTASKQLRSRIHTKMDPGDVLTAAVGGGRVKLRVVQLGDGTLSAEPISDTWIDAPHEDIFVETYRRLAAQFPTEVPPRE